MKGKTKHDVSFETLPEWMKYAADDSLVTAKDIAEFLQVSPDHVIKMSKDGRLPRADKRRGELNIPSLYPNKNLGQLTHSHSFDNRMYWKVGTLREFIQRGEHE